MAHLTTNHGVRLACLPNQHNPPCTQILWSPPSCPLSSVPVSLQLAQFYSTEVTVYLQAVSNFVRDFLGEHAPQYNFVFCCRCGLSIPLASPRIGSRSLLGDPFFAIFLHFAKPVWARKYFFAYLVFFAPFPGLKHTHYTKQINCNS